MGTTAEKLNYLKETKSEIKNALETPSNVMRDYANWIKKYVDNQPTQVVTDGVCTNALDVPLVSLGVDGNSEQKQYEGYNILNINNKQSSLINATKVVNENTVKVTSTEEAITSRMEIPVDYEINTDYTVKFHYKYIQGFENGYNPTVYMRKISPVIISNHVSLNSKEGDGIFKFNLAETGVSLWLYIKSSPLEGIATIEFSDIQIVKGTYTLENFPSYEPYVGGQPSPNPEYPQEIEIINGCNMIDMSIVSKNYYINSVNGSVIRVDDSYNALATDFIEVKENEKYYFSGMNLLNSENTGAMYNSKKEFVSGITTDYDIRPVTIPSGVKYLRLSIWGNNYDVPTNPKPVLVKGTTEKPYLPYGCIGLEHTNEDGSKSEIIPINLNGNSIAKVGDVKDLLKVYRNGDVEILDKIKHIASYNGETITNDYISNTGGLNTGAEIYYKGDEEIIQLPSIDPIELWEGTNKFELITNLDTTFTTEYVMNKNNILDEIQTAMLDVEIKI